MFAAKREKVKSTAFSDFFRHASSRDKKKFFEQVVHDSINDQKLIIEKAKQTGNCSA
ncbi:hypothetical protein ACFOEE_18330 [Pseudoalteromonas fenneropenaei]|uniref:Uncharacterized protein n=1 Tax=Pseudoalteromonas fenneropenaei TaxID=1737459 RepID=A0ABV7CPD3_9GAMM